MTRQRISVVIPCYNSASFLGQALQSVREQTRPVDEVIVIDDASTDDSAIVAQKAGISCISLQRNEGPGAARNHGIARATGELIAFLDADDYWMPTHIEEMSELLEQYPQSVVAFSRIRRFGEEDVIAPPYVPAGPPTQMFWQLIEENIVAQSSAVARRETLLRIGSYNSALRYSEDYDIWLRLSRRFPFVCTSAVTAGYRVHPNQASRNVAEMVRGRWRVKDEFLRHARVSETPAFVSLLEAQMLRTFQRALQTAWDEQDETHLCALLAIHDLVPNGESTYRTWERRHRLGWRAWLALAGAWNQLSPSVRQTVRPFVSTLLGANDNSTPLPDYLPPPVHELE